MAHLPSQAAHDFIHVSRRLKRVEGFVKIREVLRLDVIQRQVGSRWLTSELSDIGLS
jgi:hypothetical protein